MSKTAKMPWVKMRNDAGDVRYFVALKPWQKNLVMLYVAAKAIKTATNIVEDITGNDLNPRLVFSWGPEPRTVIPKEEMRPQTNVTPEEGV